MQPDDRYQLSVDTFNACADVYSDKFMHFDFYHDTFDEFLNYVDDQARLLEVACGPGNVSRYFLGQKPGLKIVGFDRAPRMIELARNCNPKVEYYVEDGRNCDRFGTDFDALVSAFYLPYIAREDALKHLGDANRALRKGGVFYLSAIEGDYSRSGIQSGSSGKQTYTHYYDAPFLKEHLSASGFEIVGERAKIFPRPNGVGDRELFFYCRKLSSVEGV